MILLILRGIWGELFPDKPWPGEQDALREIAEEVRSLRMLTDTIVTSALDEQGQRRSIDEIQRAHDLVGQYCHEMNDAVTFEHVSALCWVLRHDHNTAFAQILEMVEARLRYLGIQVVRLPELQDPAQED
jgi:hypothetical protein